MFAGLVAQGVGLWMGFQAFINMGVNLGALPTKGLTLPLMSYGGSAILMNLVALAVVLRVDYENRQLMRGGRVMSQSHCALVMAGGTGGHIFPGLAVAEALRARGWRVHWLGKPGRHGEPAGAAARLRLRAGRLSAACAARACTLGLLPLRLLRALLAGARRRAAGQARRGAGPGRLRQPSRAAWWRGCWAGR